MMQHTLYALGNLTIDDIVVYESQEVFLNTNGGNAVFSAIGALFWYKDVCIVARIGKTYPEENIAALERAGISTRLSRVPYPDMRSWALYEPDEKRQFVDQLGAGTLYQLSITGDEVPDDCIGGAGYVLAPTPSDVQLSLVKRLKRPGTVLLVDPERDDLGKPAMAAATHEMLPLIDFYLPSQKEAIDLYGKDDPPAAAMAFAKLGTPVTGVKMGADGVLLYVRETDILCHIPAYPSNVVDVTGAGDSFCGGFLAGYLLTGDPIAAACYGTVSASYVVEWRGALATLKADLSQASERLYLVRSQVSSSHVS